MITANTPLAERFRGFLPVVVDIETSGLNPHHHALLEICVVLINTDEQGCFYPDQTYFEHILPFEGAVLDPAALAFNKIDPFQPLRFALEEKQALQNLYAPIRKALKVAKCQRAVLVGHNAWFDLLFLKAASTRVGITMPFHAFTCFDTATLSGVFLGQTVLAKAVKQAGIAFDTNEAHSAIYDAKKTADLFCHILNRLSGLQNHHQ